MVEQGFAIGNGLTNPAIQYKALPDYAFAKLINQTYYNSLNQLVAEFEEAVKACGNQQFLPHYTHKEFLTLSAC